MRSARTGHPLSRRLPTTVLALCLSATAWAQLPTQASPYVDREIQGLTPEADDEGPAPNYDTTGWPRYLRLETRASTSPFDSEGSAWLGFGGYGQIETPNHGAISFDGQYAPRSGGGTFTLRQRGLPMGDGWIGNHELGVINALAPDITRLPSRVFVPSAYLRGVGGEWINADKGLQLQLGSGEPGRLGVLPETRFDATGGRRHTAGLQWRQAGDATSGLRAGWSMAVQHESARDVRDLANSSGARFDADASRLTLRHDDADLRWQAQWLTSQRTDKSRSTQGGWFDAEWGNGAWAHGSGFYRLDDGLSWAGQPMASDLEGVYLRSRYTQRRWSVDGSLDLLRSVSGRSSGGYYANANARWRLSGTDSVGGGLALRQLGDRDWNTYLDWRSANDWGPTGLRLELEGGERRPDVLRLLHDQDWQVSNDWSLSTTLGLARYGRDPSSGTGDGTQVSGALNMNVPLGSRAGVRGSLQMEQGPGSQRRESLNLGANWRIDTHWSLEGSWVWSSGRTSQAFTLDPLAPPITIDNTLSNRAFYVALRYELEAGSRSVPLGGRAADGGGRIDGVVFFDENRNGRQEANETGVPNATVYLDNRYAVRTDSQGRFSFPFVATGQRAVTLRGDSLPLPWNVVGDGSTAADVPLRGTVQLSLPVQRAE
ncbi:MAG: hypothetical protein KF871_00845 [Hydrogenophaga sp.]|uniref:SdrD B-like domain-containing protein n=1 Tax=Hydrogenophaga sp. TaxID=1904254 RepID=UPI001D9AAFD1|nr:SdrD B-like domain-containing protein [Hydrogenophaga sp.]MBX3608414.1 hypothetical protein [Hydrogenophaga sp.]